MTLTRKIYVIAIIAVLFCITIAAVMKISAKDKLLRILENAKSEEDLIRAYDEIDRRLATAEGRENLRELHNSDNALTRCVEVSEYVGMKLEETSVPPKNSVRGNGKFFGNK